MPNIISKIRYYNCGYCTNDMGLVFRHHKKLIKQFPAGVFLIKHPDKGYILFDTGYSTDIYNIGIKGKLYGLFNPTFVKKEDQINYQLKKDNIDCSEIKYLILSHLHPDHIGCVRYFRNAQIILSGQAYITYRLNKTRYLIFDELLPRWFEKRLRILTDKELQMDKNEYFPYFDLFGDNSIKLTVMNGHAKGQLCALVEDRVFLGADSSWGGGFVGKAREFRAFPRLIQSDMAEYIASDELLKKMRDDGIRLCFSHDTYDEEVISV